jgi:acetylornithine deacetylase/succinyl-diaminopimelate desuccinylase family protein
MSYIREHQTEFERLLADLVAFQTESPPARNAGPAQAYVASQLRDLGFTIDQWELFPGDPNVVGVRKGDPAYRSLIINTHIDVAHVGDDADWPSPPFTMTRVGDRVVGRGVADMKGGTAAALFALKALKANGELPPGEIIFESVIGEEMGEAGTRACNERGYTADFALVADTSNLAIQGQGGVITGWITIQSPQTFHDGNRSRMIHAGGGLFGASAIEKMMKVMQSLQELERHWAVTKRYEGFPPGTTTINPAVIEGGRHPAFIADRCALWITVHFYPGETYESVSREIEHHVLAAAAADPWLREHPPTFTWGGRSMLVDRGEIFPALPLDHDHAAVQLLGDCVAQATGRAPVLAMSPSVTDAGWMGDAGIPAAICGPGELAQAHATGESVAWEQLVQAAELYTSFIKAWCGRQRG